MNDLLRHRGPDGDGMWMHERRHAGFAHRRLAIIDLETGDAADDGRARQLDHLQRRDLQLHRAARRARARRVPHDVGHRGRPPRLRPLGRRSRSTGSAGCSRSRSGTRPSSASSARATASASSRSTTPSSTGRSSARPRRRRCCRSCRRSRPTSTGSATTSRSSSASPARRCSRASTSCRRATC